MAKYFTYRKTAPDLESERLIIVPLDYETFPFNTKKGGSYGIAPARVLGLDYPTYLRFIKQSFPSEVTIEGKGSAYPTAYWRKGKELFTFIDLLNARLTLAVMEMNNGK